MQDGSSRNLFISPNPLTSIFRSSFEELLTLLPRFPETAWSALSGLFRAKNAGSNDLFRARGARTPSSSGSLFGGSPVPLQSEGGANRFLGVSIEGSQAYSVGHPRDDWAIVRSDWVEWRPFVFESIPHHFPDAKFVLGADKPTTVPGERYQEALLESALALPIQDRLDIPVCIEISRNSIAAFVARLARTLAGIHGAASVHGDLKPSNLLLAPDGIKLIDDFQLKVGDVAPGWTPGWSAPEQALGEPVSSASDVYPIGLMITEVLGGQLVGEVRKFKTALGGNRREEFDVFYNPSVYVSPDGLNASGAIFRTWTDLARRCLRFNPDERPVDMLRLAEEIDTLREKCPLKGVCRVKMNSNLVWATFLARLSYGANLSRRNALAAKGLSALNAYIRKYVQPDCV
jgi:hypothetical protein